MISLADIVQSMNGSVASQAHKAPKAALPSLHAAPFAHIVIDSRLASAGDLFVALPGEQVDGHHFVAAALRQGARAALVRESWAASEGQALGVPIVRSASDLAALSSDQPVLCSVADPLTSLQEIAAAYRRRFKLHVVGITGSVGKTTTKEVLAAVLRQRLTTLYSVKSWNNEIGVPLTLLRLEPHHEVAVIEMGTYGPGEIAQLCDWAQPNYAIVTNVGVSHLERMKSPDVVAMAKSELPQALPPDGVAILNYDDRRVRAMADVTPGRPIFFGRTPAADLWADELVSFGLDGIAFTVHGGGEQRRLRVPLVGLHLVETALAVIAVARDLGLDWASIEAGLNDPTIQQRLSVRPGLNGSVLLDDTYNAAPVSCKAALDLLKELPGRHIAAFGAMAELGSMEEEGHREVGRAAAAVVSTLVVVGDKAHWIGEAAQAVNPAVRVIFARSNGEAVMALRRMLAPGDHVLVKGARVAATEEIIEALAVGD